METTNPRKAGALILNNLSLFNEAAILMEQQITVKVFEVFQEIISAAIPAMPCSPAIA